ncbi:MAG: hypothetical protein H7281_03940 [Bacteriovorax sp.]|nr:hypothetical protein [Bacteriovorax sp.]
MGPNKNAPPHNNLFIVLESIYFLHRIGDHQAALVLSEDSEKDIGKSPIHLVLAQMIDLIRKYEQNIFNANDYSDLTNNLQKPIEESGIAFYQGWLHFLLGYHLKNEDELKLAASLFLEGSHLSELYEVYYWMNNFRLLPVEEKFSTFLRTYPVKSIYSKIMGNTFYKEELKPLTQIQKAQTKNWLIEEDDEVDGGEEEDSFNCWLISGNAITPAQYKNIDHNDESFLDIYAGLINDRGEYSFLLITELNCLSFLIAAQLTGASTSQIAEFLVRSEKDTEEIINSIVRMGIKINKINGQYFLNWDAKPKIIIPRTLKVIGLQEFVKKKAPIFSKAQLIDLLQLTQFGAEALMKRWALSGFIRPTEKTEKANIWKFL